MRRLFIPGLLSETVTLTGGDARHLGYTLRARAGERCVVVDAARAAASMEITGFTRDTVTLRLVERLAADTEPSVRVTLAMCLPKADKMDFIVQKAVELGASRVQPLASARSVVRYDEKKSAARREKWQRVADEAAKQCARSALLEVEPIRPLSAWLSARRAEDGAAFFCCERETRRTLGDWLRRAAGADYTALVGPEGGFSEEEAEAARRAGLAPVTLGPRILRAETAALAALAVVQYEKGDLGARRGGEGADA